jgi:hypothetical protein
LVLRPAAFDRIDFFGPEPNFEKSSGLRQEMAMILEGLACHP